jgi:tetratricopeptide (TPR) repeat protein
MTRTRTPTPLAVTLLLGLTALTGTCTQVLAEPRSTRTATTLEADLLDPVKQAAARQEAEKLLVCDAIGDPQEKAAAFARLRVMKWDRKQMGCGVRYGFELAQRQPKNIELQLQVLGAHVDYYTVLDKHYSRIYSASAVKDAELHLRWNETREHSAVLLDRLAPLADQIAEVPALRGLNTLLSLQHESDDKEKLSAPGRARGDLEAAVKARPDVLEGTALLVLGNLIAALPEFAGGDTERAIMLLEQSNEIAPKSLQMKTALIDLELGERNADKALALLNVAIGIGEEGQNAQDYADALRVLAGQALRLDQRDLAKQIDTRRDAFLAAHAYIDPRKTTATTGHGGVDPITGQDPEKIQ